MFDWDDGTNSGWIGPYESGQTATASHIWTSIGSYSVKVKAKDSNDYESSWSEPLPISMPKIKSVKMNSLLIEYLENHPRMFPILQQLLKIWIL